MSERTRNRGVEIPSPSAIRYFVGTIESTDIGTSPLSQALKDFTRRQPHPLSEDDTVPDDKYYFDLMENEVLGKGRKLTLAIAQDEKGQTIGAFGTLINPNALSPVCFVYWSVDESVRKQGIGTSLLTLNAGELFFQGYTHYASSVNQYSRRLVERNEMGTLHHQLTDPQTGLMLATFSFDEPRLRRAYAAAGLSFDQHQSLRAA